MRFFRNMEAQRKNMLNAQNCHYNPSSLISLAWRGIRLLGKLNLQFRDLCKARAL